jgi:ABC-2 type transport system permease protein
MLLAAVREARFMRHDRGTMLWLAFAFLLSLASVGFGLAEVREQRATIAQLQSEDAADRANAIAGQSDWGGAAYNAFHLTYAPPSAFAFAAMGQRDANPWLHRVRMLALEGQIHEADTRNADFGLIGRFDFAFLAATVAPLILILLLYDLRGGERVAGRHDLLLATAGRPSRLWLPRLLVRAGALALVLLVPFWAGAIIEGTGFAIVLRASAMVLFALVLWTAIVEAIGRWRATPATILTALVGVWLALALLVPALAKAAIDARYPAPDGGQILLLQRESVNGAWDIPKQATMQPFLARHPEWAEYAEVNRPFEWKWFFAFQQVGDQKAEPLARQYRAARLARDRAAGLAAFLSPSALVERYFEHLAGTDAAAMIAYEDAVRAYHAQLRAFYYPLLFRDEPYDPVVLGGLPAYEAAAN